MASILDVTKSNLIKNTCVKCANVFSQITEIHQSWMLNGLIALFNRFPLCSAINTISVRQNITQITDTVLSVLQKEILLKLDSSEQSVEIQ